MPSLPERRAAEDAVTELFDARHRLRRAVVYAALEDGRTPERIAHVREVPVQLVCALAAESPYLGVGPVGDGPESVGEYLTAGCRAQAPCPQCPSASCRCGSGTRVSPEFRRRPRHGAHRQDPDGPDVRSTTARTTTHNLCACRSRTRP